MREKRKRNKFLNESWKSPLASKHIDAHYNRPTKIDTHYLDLTCTGVHRKLMVNFLPFLYPELRKRRLLHEV
jgi:hypothetical protein